MHLMIAEIPFFRRISLENWKCETTGKLVFVVIFSGNINAVSFEDFYPFFRVFHGLPLGLVDHRLSLVDWLNRKVLHELVCG